jgi:protein-S-isoprenylcysteine O-methyltransferase Ste14
LAVLDLLTAGASPGQERSVDRLLGLSFMSWAVLGTLASPGGAHITAVRLVTAALHLSAGILLVFRTPVLRRCPAEDIAASLPCLLIGGWAMNATTPPQEWPWYAQSLFVASGCLAIAALTSLGRSFAIFPAVRDIVVRGPFQYVRHPAYLAELLMILACGIANIGIGSLVPFAFAVPMVVLRIHREERILSSSFRYTEYAREVRWRLVPRVW